MISFSSLFCRTAGGVESPTDGLGDAGAGLLSAFASCSMGLEPEVDPELEEVLVKDSFLETGVDEESESSRVFIRRFLNISSELE